MAKVGYLYFFGCWVVLVNEKCIGKFHTKQEALNCAEDYNELHCK